jgi:hypothetical protein
MNNTLWYYELLRTVDGGFFATMGRSPYPAGSTGQIGLALTLPRRVIRVTGAERSVFGKRPPFDLREAAALYRQKRWPALESALAEYLSNDRAPNRDYARGLLDKYRGQQAQVAATLRLVEGDIEAEKRSLALSRLDSLRRLLGEEAAGSVELRARAVALQRDTSRPALLPSFEERVQARSVFFSPIEPNYDWEFLVSWSNEADASRQGRYEVYVADSGEKPDLGAWYRPEYQPQGWRRGRGPVNMLDGKRQVWVRKTFATLGDPGLYKHFQVLSRVRATVYLNGFRIADRSAGEFTIRPDAGELLRKDGVNVLAAYFPAGGGAADVAFQAGPPVIPDLEGLLDDL